MSEIKLKKITIQGRDTGEFVQAILDKIAEGYVFDQYQTHKVGYVHYATMLLGEPEPEVKPKKAKASKSKE